MGPGLHHPRLSWEMHLQQIGGVHVSVGGQGMGANQAQLSRRPTIHMVPGVRVWVLSRQHWDLSSCWRSDAFWPFLRLI